VRYDIIVAEEILERRLAKGCLSNFKQIGIRGVKTAADLGKT
jgi:hypothetical protein